MIVGVGRAQEMKIWAEEKLHFNWWND